MFREINEIHEREIIKEEERKRQQEKININFKPSITIEEAEEIFNRLFEED